MRKRDLRKSLDFALLEEKGTTSKKLGAYLARSVKIPHTDCQVVACRRGVTRPKCGGGRYLYIALPSCNPLPPVDVAPANRAMQHSPFVKLDAPIQYQPCINIRQQGNAASSSCCGLSDNFGSAWKTLLVLLITFWRGCAKQSDNGQRSNNSGLQPSAMPVK